MAELATNCGSATVTNVLVIVNVLVKRNVKLTIWGKRYVKTYNPPIEPVVWNMLPCSDNEQVVYNIYFYYLYN